MSKLRPQRQLYPFGSGCCCACEEEKAAGGGAVGGACEGGAVGGACGMAMGAGGGVLVDVAAVAGGSVLER